MPSGSGKTELVSPHKDIMFLISSWILKRCEERLQMPRCPQIKFCLKRMAIVVCLVTALTLPMLKLLSSKGQGGKDVWKPSKPCQVGIHLIALTENSHEYHMCQGINNFSVFLFYFVLAKLATTSIGVQRHIQCIVFCARCAGLRTCLIWSWICRPALCSWSGWLSWRPQQCPVAHSPYPGGWLCPAPIPETSNKHQSINPSNAEATSVQSTIKTNNDIMIFYAFMVE